MKKIICNLVIVGCALLGAACSEDNTPISGVEYLNPHVSDTSNVSSVDISYEGCRSVDPNHPDDTLHGCIYSNEMWNRKSGYRVRTGFDNGTNTSGIWNWSVNAANGRNVQVNWSKPVSESYDSMSLAKVIDYCHGSLCGMAVFDKIEDSSRKDSASVKENSSVSIKFSFAGRNASGNFKSVDARAMQGICIEYIADAMRMELDLGDSLNSLMEGNFYGVDLPSFPMKGSQGDSEGNKICYPWNQFKLPNTTETGELPVSIDDAVSHLQGMRFTLSTNQRYAVINQFDIIGLGRYAGQAVESDSIRPANETCQVSSVKDYFCECSYPIERSDEIGKQKVFEYFTSLGIKDGNDSIFLSMKAQNCISNYSFELQKNAKSSKKNWDCACADLLPKTIACADGSEIESRDFAEMMETFNANANKFFEQQKPMADSLYQECMNLRDTLFNGELVPDSCRIEEFLLDKNILYLPYTRDVPANARLEFEKRMDSLYRIDSLDEATRYCILQRFPNVSQKEVSNEMPRMAPRINNPIVKSLRCKSGNVYYTDEYKLFLQEIGIKDDTDSLDVYNAAKKYSLQQMKNQIDVCVENYGKDGVIWEAVWTRVNTGFDNGTGTSGRWFYETDSLDGGDSHIEWIDNYVVDDWNNPKAFDALLSEHHSLNGKIIFTDKEIIMAPYVNIGFWLAGEDGKGGHTTVDVTDKEGLCFMQEYSNGDVYVQLDMGDSLNAVVNYNLYSVRTKRSSSIVPDCYTWNMFKQASWGPKIDLKEALKHVAGVRLHFVNTSILDKVVSFAIYQISYPKP